MKVASPVLRRGRASNRSFLFGRDKYESEVGEIERITGISRIVRDNEIKKLLSELYFRTPPDGVKVLKLTEFFTKSAVSYNRIEMDFLGKIEALELFISYLLAQRKAVFSRKIVDNFKLYTSITRKGYAKLIVGIFENKGKVSVQIEIHTEELTMPYIMNFSQNNCNYSVKVCQCDINSI